MKGFELIFIAPRSHRHKRGATLDAVIDIARQNGIRRYTRRVDAESMGTGGHVHSAHFFELTDEPEELMFILDDAQTEALLNAVRAAEIKVFCVCRPVDYWYFGTD